MPIQTNHGRTNLGRANLGRTNLGPLVAVGVTLTLWASAFVAIRYLGESFSPGALALGRLIVGTLALGVVSLARGYLRPTRHEWLAIAGIGVLWFGIYNVALNEGEKSVDAGTAAMLLQVSPLLIAMLAAVFLAEPFTVYLGAGLAVAFAGVLVIGLSAPESTGSEGAGRHVVGVVLCLLCCVVYSVSVILQKPLLTRLPALQITWLACTIGMLVCLPFAPALAREALVAAPHELAWLVYLGLFPTAVAFTTYAYALGHMSAGRLGVTTYLVPPIAIAMGWLFLREAPAGLAYAGGVLALVGVAVARRTQRPPAATPRLAD
ncbi:MAG: DMT family transporter [Nocardioides sp.]